jgi:glycosyltransferase involved in cell wall biosynthesis
MPQEHLLAIPVFNEQRYLSRVLVKARLYSRSILVVDDGSTDGTGEILRRQHGVRYITHPWNLGYGKSTSDAFEFVQQQGYEWLITMDCDEQHEPACIPDFVAAATCDDADIISGTRYPGGFDVDGAAPQDRRRINRIITQTVNRRLNLGITDAFCGFKAYRVSALEHLSITVPGYAMPMQLWVQAARAALRIKELAVPLIYDDPTRHFGGVLDDPQVRYAHYMDVFESEMAVAASGPAPCGSGCLACR